MDRQLIVQISMLILFTTSFGSDSLAGVWQCPNSAAECPSGGSYIAGANWKLCWRQAADKGIVVERVCFQNRRVMYEGDQPFALTDYHGFSPTYKDGLAPLCGGAGMTLIPGTSVAGVFSDDDNPGFPAFGYPSGPDYNKIEIASTYHLGWYRYRARWIFRGTGVIDAMLGLGGFLNPNSPDLGHIHSQYWRLDMDVVHSTPNYVEEFNHPDLTSNSDTWTLLPTEGARLGSTPNFTKWRVRSGEVNSQGQYRSYEIETIVSQTYEYTSADMWPTAYNGGEDGAIVGTAACDDRELSTVYSTPPENINGADVVLWIQATHHHETRYRGEERSRMPGFEWTGIHLSPRNFTDDTP